MDSQRQCRFEVTDFRDISRTIQCTPTCTDEQISEVGKTGDDALTIWLVIKEAGDGGERLLGASSALVTPASLEERTKAALRQSDVPAHSWPR